MQQTPMQQRSMQPRAMSDAPTDSANRNYQTARNAANIPPQPSDCQLLEFLAAAGRLFVLIATKSDRLSGNQLQKSMQDLANQYQGTRILAYSAKTGTGREELWQEIRLAADRVQQSQS